MLDYNPESNVYFKNDVNVNTLKLFKVVIVQFLRYFKL